MLKNLPVPVASSIVSKHTQREVNPVPSTPRKANVNGKQRGRPSAADTKSDSPKQLPQNQAQYLVVTPQLSPSPAQPINLVMSHMQNSQTYPTTLLPTQLHMQPWTSYETMASALQTTMLQPIQWQTPPGQTPRQETAPAPQALMPPPPNKTAKRKLDEWTPTHQNTEGATRKRKTPEKLSL